MKPAEKRAEARARGALPLSFENATGILHDMNASGAFFWISGAHAVGETVTFSIALRTDGAQMVWTCQGEVVGIQTRGQDAGAAVKITRTAVEPMWR